MVNLKKSVACYVRVSTVMQNESGQRIEIDRWLTGNGIDADSVRWYVDRESGDTLKRPAFDKLQRDIFNGEVGTVIVWKLDRLSRVLRDGIEVICQWCDRGLRIVSITQGIDFNSTVGKIIASVLLGVAEMEQQTRRERQAVGIAAAKSRGVYKGRRKGTTKAKPARARKLREQGLKDHEIAKSLGVCRQTVQRYLNGSDQREAHT